MPDINDLDKLDEMEVTDFAYLQMWDAELQKCWCEQEVNDLIEENYVRVTNDENIMLLFKQRKESLFNALGRARSGNTLSAKEINMAVAMASKMPNT